MTNSNTVPMNDANTINSNLNVDHTVPQFDSLVDAINVLSELTNSDANNQTIASLDEVDIRTVSGGDINDASLLTLKHNSSSQQSKQVFLKQNTLKNAPILFAEVDGLTAIHATGARTCEPLAYGVDNKLGRSFLLLSVIHSYQGNMSNKKANKAAGWHDLAHQLATLHKAKPPQPKPSLVASGDDNSNLSSPWYAGWFDDNYIGSSPQRNRWTDNWHEFFAVQRLGVQAKMAFDNQRINRQTLQQIERLQQKLPQYLPDYPLTDESAQPRPSLLHGDLWAGNAMLGLAIHDTADKTKQPLGYLIDPAVYVGHPETDLAMTQLFGGFSESFYEAYLTYGLTEAGFADRVDIYNLYHYLNHLNLFGGGYLGAVQRIAQRYGG